MNSRDLAFEAVRSSVKLAGFVSGRIYARKDNPVTVFTFHRASETEVGEVYARAGVLQSWIQRIGQHYSVIDPREFGQSWVDIARGEKPKALITIDDAFDDCYHVIWPLLKQFGLPALLFVPTEFIESPECLPVSYQADPSSHRPCNWAQIGEMADSGLIRLGAHSHRHEVVSTLSDEQLRADCEKHSSVFASQGLPTPEHYAYPRGVFTVSAARVLREYYRFAFAGSPHHVLPSDLSNMAIPRVPLRGSDQTWAGALKLRGWPSHEERLIELAKRMRDRLASR